MPLSPLAKLIYLSCIITLCSQNIKSDSYVVISGSSSDQDNNNKPDFSPLATNFSEEYTSYESDPYQSNFVSSKTKRSDIKLTAGVPSLQPTSQPSRSPSSEPSTQPSQQPLTNPSNQPSISPSISPSGMPSMGPSAGPTNEPSSIPSQQPSGVPSLQPASHPSRSPSSEPSTQPSQQPLTNPSNQPSISPSISPSGMPSLQPNANPSYQPSSIPSLGPSADTSHQPIIQPTSQPIDTNISSSSGNPATTIFTPETITGVTVGSAFVLALIVAGLYYHYQARNNEGNNPENNAQPDLEQPENENYDTTTSMETMRPNTTGPTSINIQQPENILLEDNPLLNPDIGFTSPKVIPSQTPTPTNNNSHVAPNLNPLAIRTPRKMPGNKSKENTGEFNRPKANPGSPTLVGKAVEDPNLSQTQT